MTSYHRTDRCQAKNPATCRNHGVYVLPASATLPYEKHKEASEKAQFFLTKSEVSKISQYLDRDYTTLNACLKGGVAASSEEQSRIDVIDNALKRLQPMVGAGTPVLTFRATKAYRDFSSVEEAASWVKTTFPVGQKIVLPGFTSVTANPVALFDFLTWASEDETPNIGSLPWQKPSLEEWYSYKGKQPNPGLGNLVFVIETRTGVPVSSYGQQFDEKEQEYLYPKDSSFRVKKVLPYRKIPHPDPSSGWGRKSAHASIVFLEET